MIVTFLGISKISSNSRSTKEGFNVLMSASPVPRGETSSGREESNAATSGVRSPRISSTLAPADAARSAKAFGYAAADAGRVTTNIVDGERYEESSPDFFGTRTEAR